jgi:hypothetical protein
MVGVEDDWVAKDEGVAEIPENKGDGEEDAAEVDVDEDVSETDADDGEEKDDADFVDAVHLMVALQIEVESSSLVYRELVVAVMVAEVACRSCSEQEGGVDVGEEVFVERDAFDGAVVVDDVVAALSSLIPERERFLGGCRFVVDYE